VRADPVPEQFDTVEDDPVGGLGEFLV